MLRISLAGDHSNYHCGSAAAFSVIRSEAARWGRLVAAADDFDLLIVNGEGSMHHDSRGFRRKMAILEEALDRGKRAMLVNTVWQDNPPEYASILRRCERVIARDMHSQRALAGQGVCSDLALDPSYYAPIDPDAPHEDYQDQVVFTDFWSHDFDCFARLNSKWAQQFPYVDLQMNSWSSLIASLRTASGLATGRHHAVYAACCARTPFVYLPGNTYKIEGLVDTAGVDLPPCDSLAGLRRIVDEGAFPTEACNSLFDWMAHQPRWSLGVAKS